MSTQPLSWATLESNSGLSCLEAAAKVVHIFIYLSTLPPYICVSAKVGQLDTVRRLLAREPQDSSTAGVKEAAVRAAASCGHAPVLSLLLGQGAGAGAGHLQEAAAGGHLECVAALLEAAPALLDQADTEVYTFNVQSTYMIITMSGPDPPDPRHPEQPAPGGGPAAAEGSLPGHRRQERPGHRHLPGDKTLYLT